METCKTWFFYVHPENINFNHWTLNYALHLLKSEILTYWLIINLLVRPNKIICVVPVTRPTLFYSPDPKHSEPLVRIKVYKNVRPPTLSSSNFKGVDIFYSAQFYQWQIVLKETENKYVQPRKPETLELLSLEVHTFAQHQLAKFEIHFFPTKLE